MSNNKNNKNTPPPTPAVATKQEETIEVIENIEPVEEVGITTALASDIVPVNALVKKYSEVLPHLATYIQQFSPPTKKEIASAVENLPPAERENMIKALAGMTPIKRGVHTAQRAFSLPEMRTYQGTGKDPLRPGETPKGGIYTTDGRILAAPKSALKMLQNDPRYKTLSDTVDVYVVSLIAAATFWPPRKAPNPPNVEIRPDVPICRSLDRKRGDKFGDCSVCNWRPFKEGGELPDGTQPDYCRFEHHVYVVPVDFSGIYRFVFSGTSIGPGSAAMDKKSKPWPTPWTKRFTLEAKETTNAKGTFFQVAADISSNSTPNTPEADVLLNLFAGQIDFEIYFPGLAAIYNTKPVDQGSVGTAGDLDALIAGVEVPGAAAAPAAPVKAPPRNL